VVGVRTNLQRISGRTVDFERRGTKCMLRGRGRGMLISDRTLSKGKDEYRRMDEDGKRQLCVVSLDSWHCKNEGWRGGGRDLWKHVI